MKRLLNAFFAALLVCGLLSVSALAAVEDYPKEFREGKTSEVIKPQMGSTFALQQDGSLWAWGRADLGSLGNNGEYDKEADGGKYRSYPQKVLTDVKYFAAPLLLGDDRALAIKKDGSLWYTGGMVSYDTLGFLIVNPAYQMGFTKLMDNVVSAGNGRGLDGEAALDSAIYAVDGSGTLWQFGFAHVLVSGTGVIVIGETPTPSSYKVEIKKEKVMDSVKKVFTDTGSCFVLKTDGSLWGWGSPKNGQLGNGVVEGNDGDGDIPVNKAIKILDDVKDVYAGTGFFSAIQKNGSLWVWGRTPDGIQSTPLKVADGVKKTIAGTWGADVAILKEDGTLWVWGESGLINKLGGAAALNSIVKTTLIDVKDIAASPYFGQFFYVTSAGSLFVLGGTENYIAYAAEDKPVQLTGLSNALPSVTTTVFTDVAATSPYATAIQWAVDKGITSGTSATTFAPDAICTRGQIVTFLHRDLGK